MTYEARYKEFEQFLLLRNLEWKNVRVGQWLSACRMSTDLGRQNFCLNKPRFFFETSHYHKQLKF